MTVLYEQLKTLTKSKMLLVLIYTFECLEIFGTFGEGIQYCLIPHIKLLDNHLNTYLEENIKALYY